MFLSCILMWPMLVAQVWIGFLKFIWTFSGRNHFQNNIFHILNPNLSPLNLVHQYLSNNTKGKFHQFLQKSHLQLNLIFSEKIIQYSRTSTSQVQTPWNQTNAPLLLKSFPKTPRTRSKTSSFSGSHEYKQNKTKQTNYFPS